LCWILERAPPDQVRGHAFEDDASFYVRGLERGKGGGIDESGHLGVEVTPEGVAAIDQLLGSWPFLELFLTPYRLIHGLKKLEMHELMHSVSACEALDQTLLVDGNTKAQ
jgi:hypothetical protein